MSPTSAIPGVETRLTFVVRLVLANLWRRTAYLDERSPAEARSNNGASVKGVKTSTDCYEEGLKMND